MPGLEEIGFKETFKIRTNEIDVNKCIKIPSLIQLLQEASMSNAINLKVSVWDLEDQALSWVLVKKEINIIKLPKLGDIIEVITYPSGMERLFAYRDFIVKNEAGQVIVTASSTWILMNTNTRKLVIPEFKIPLPTNIEPLKRPSFNFTRIGESSLKRTFEVNWHDLDWNQHVNNVFLLKCIIEGCPDDILTEGNIKNIRIQYKTESFWKDKLISNYYSTDSSRSSHSITRASDEKIIAIAEIDWK